ncbi:MAG: hypothetical protein JWP00_3566 [Chloroflexi bacterium]|jgi:hypothetical protein|nr:hypothetical protein [Chloroflexota bacterium]
MMKTTIFDNTQDQTGLTAQELESFLVSYVLESAHLAYQENSTKNLWWQLPGSPNMERRLLLNFDASQALITVSSEVTYQLFDGDFHFVVQQAGTVEASGLQNSLPGIVAKALQEINAWKPTCEYF